MIKCLKTKRISNERPTYALEVTLVKVTVPSFLRFDLILTDQSSVLFADIFGFCRPVSMALICTLITRNICKEKQVK